MKRALTVFSLALPMLAAVPASAMDLLQAWQAAQLHDPEYAAAHAAADAGGTRRDQARAMWRPTVALTATAGRMSNDTATTGAQFSAPGFGQSTGVAFDTSIRDGNLERYALTAKQPLFNPGLSAQSRQLSLAADIAEAEWQNDRQALMLRVAERYFAMQVVAESLRLLRQQQAAIERTRAESADRFKLGSVPVTDTYEAAARAETVKAQAMAAEMDLRIKQAALADLIGEEPRNLAVLKSTPSGALRDLPSLDASIKEASLHNPMLSAQEKSQAVAREEVGKHSALAAPSLDLVAQIGHERLSGNGDFGSAENSASDRMIGVQLTIPLFTGGYRSAQHAEALHLADKARAEGEHLNQQIAAQTRAAWLGLSVGIGRVAALEQAHKASQARLDATRLGRSVGDRTTLDLLNAENDASAAELAVLQARVALVLDRMRLAALAGNLDENALRSINESMQQEEGH